MAEDIVKPEPDISIAESALNSNVQMYPHFGCLKPALVISSKAGSEWYFDCEPAMPKQFIWLRIIGRDLSGLWMMVTIGACCGFVINHLRDNPLPLVYSPKTERIQGAVTKLAADLSAVPDTARSAVTNVPLSLAVATVRQLELPEFRAFVETKTRGIVLDARPEIFHQLGHVPGAISLPREEFETSYRIRRLVLETDKSQPIVVYCSDSSCEDSQMVADALVKLAYTYVFVFKGGWDAWTKAHLPEEKGR